MYELITLPFYWLIIGLLPTILLGTLFLGLFGVDTDEEKYLGSKICLISVILGAVIYYMELI